MLPVNKIICGDCLEVMKSIDDKSIDMILCDLPYGVTACKWDNIIPLDVLWGQYKRIIKNNAAIVLTAREPFTSMLIMSNLKQYKHKWIWNKKQSGSFQNAKYMPLQIEEDIICFSNGKVNYYPIMRTGKFRQRGGAKEKSRVVGNGLKDGYKNFGNLYYPINIIEFINPRRNKFHPTQKSIALFEYLVKTYTNENDLILDNCAGSCTTAIACINTNRNWICIEKEQTYCDIGNKRIEEIRKKQLNLWK